MQSYYQDCGRYPSDAQGLVALWEKPLVDPIPAAWKGPYLDRQFLFDPWGNAYHYRESGEQTFAIDLLSSSPAH
jgi:general secretion pathway protein G